MKNLAKIAGFNTICDNITIRDSGLLFWPPCIFVLLHMAWHWRHSVHNSYVTAAMLEVYIVATCDVVHLSMLANCCVWNWTVRLSKYKVFCNLASALYSLFAHIKYTSNMAA